MPIKVAFLLAGLLILAFFAGLGAVLFWIARKNRREDEVRESGQVVVGWIVQANRVLYEKYQMDAPAQVLITFDRELAEDIDQMRELAEDLGRLKEGWARTPDEDRLARLVRDETARFGRRDPLPKRFTGGPTVYSVAVMVRRRYLPRGRITYPYIYCVAQPGRDGGEVYMTEYPEDHDGSPPRRYRRRHD
jgi:hypothetical protein